MDEYYVNKHPNPISGYHEVHAEGCSHFPQDDHTKYIGKFLDCKEATEEATLYYKNVDGCYWCCRPCSKINLNKF